MKIKARFVSIWDVDSKGRGIEIETDCDINIKTFDVDAETVSEDLSESVEILDREYVYIENYDGSRVEFEVEDGHIKNKAVFKEKIEMLFSEV
jgi:hypothetical protein